MNSLRFWGRVLLGACLTIPTLAVGAAPAGIENTYKEHTRAVEAARAGHYDAGLAILERLLEQFPDDYPLQRDVILINTWKGDCPAALHRFKRIQARTTLDAYLIRPVADCAVKQARAGEHDHALTVLKSLRDRVDDPYPLNRDITIVTIWKGSCIEGLREFERVRGHARMEDYFIAPVAECLLERDRPIEADAMIESGLRRYPDNAELKRLRAKVAVALALDRPTAEIAVASDESDQGLRETRFTAAVDARLTSWASVYTRYLMTRSDDDDFDNGDLDRAAIGVLLQPAPRWRIDQEFSTDIGRSGKGGSRTGIGFKPVATLDVYAEYTTYAVDIPLRARAADIEAKRSEAAVGYESVDYVWEWRVVATRYDFTDTNRRTNVFALAGYAWELLPEREQRLFVEWYQSRNTFDDAVYFNPERDRSIGLTHRTDFVFDTRFKRHVDSLSFGVSAYSQKGFGTETPWNVSYRQEYDFDGTNAAAVGAGFARNYYDGRHEDELRLEAMYRRRF